MRATTTLALVSLGLIACAAGCQSSGTTESSADAARPVYTTPAPVAVDEYGVAYVTRADTPWMRTAADATAAGSLPQGSVVNLRTAAPATGMVQAKLPDGRIVYVRAADLVAK